MINLPGSSSKTALFEDELCENAWLVLEKMPFLRMDYGWEDRIKNVKVRKIYFIRSFFFLRLGLYLHQKQ